MDVSQLGAYYKESSSSRSISTRSLYRAFVFQSSCKNESIGACWTYCCASHLCMFLTSLKLGGLSPIYQKKKNHQKKDNNWRMQQVLVCKHQKKTNSLGVDSTWR